jgi:ABC-2 type transport system ATP-binding protein
MKPDSGEIRVFGELPKSKKFGIPGFMPQDINLIDIFTIEEMIEYFGKIYGMSNNAIAETVNYFIRLFELPYSEECIKNLSGGQRRAVSFIVSVMHRPKLIILDEPSVGLDPILRENMWSFLEETVQLAKSTIIITTHYVEEAVRATEVGIMRKGKLLAVDSPQRILNNLQSDTLENAFLELCNRNGNFYEATFGRKEIENFKYKDSTEEEPYKRSKTRAALARIRMLNLKNSRIILRHIAY